MLHLLLESSERLQIVNERMRNGDWEGDPVYGQNGIPCSLVERTSRFTLCGRTQTKCKDEAASVINGLFDTLQVIKRHYLWIIAANLRLTPKSINAIPSMFFLQNHTQAGKEEQMKILMADSGNSGQKICYGDSFSRGNRQWSAVVEFDTEKGLKRANPAGSLHWQTCCTYYLNSAINFIILFVYYDNDIYMVGHYHKSIQFYKQQKTVKHFFTAKNAKERE